MAQEVEFGYADTGHRLKPRRLGPGMRSGWARSSLQSRTVIRRVSLTAGLAVLSLLAVGTAAFAADNFAVGSFKGHTSQVVRDSGRSLRGTVTITTALDSAHQTIVSRFAPFYFTACKIDPTPMGFWTNAPVPYGFFVHSNGRFDYPLHYTVKTTDDNNGDPITGKISARLSAVFTSPFQIKGRFQATVKVYEHNRQINTCTANFTFTANRHK